MRVIFLGTPEFAQPTLQRLIEWPDAEVVAVVAQPDRPAGRGQKLHKPATGIVAEAHGIPLFQPEKLSRSPETVEAMRALEPDVLVMVAFGQILKKSVLYLAPNGVVNLHGSLLPRYRGAAPINWAIINGETAAGVTTMFSDQGVDTGKMLLKREVTVGPDATAGEIAEQLAEIGADLIVETLARLKAGTLEPEAQDSTLATYAPLLKKEMGRIDWSKSGPDIHNLVRGLLPWPGTYTHFDGSVLKILRTAPSAQPGHDVGVPGAIVAASPKVLVACGPGGQETLEVIDVKPENRSAMPARDWANGVRLQPGAGLGQGAGGQ